MFFATGCASEMDELREQQRDAAQGVREAQEDASDSAREYQRLRQRRDEICSRLADPPSSCP
jgi:uncharacterized coiled-coil DUF342 family protein